MVMEIIVIGGGISGRLFQFYVPEAQVLDWGKLPKKNKVGKEEFKNLDKSKL